MGHIEGNHASVIGFREKKVLMRRFPYQRQNNAALETSAALFFPHHHL
jgi:hypothetical protein